MDQAIQYEVKKNGKNAIDCLLHFILIWQEDLLRKLRDELPFLKNNS